MLFQLFFHSCSCVYLLNFTFEVYSKFLIPVYLTIPFFDIPGGSWYSNLALKKLIALLAPGLCQSNLP